MPRATKQKSPALGPAIETAIHTLRGERVILDADLAKIYGVETRSLKQAVRRNREKFPADFFFELTLAEAASLQRTDRTSDANSRSQIVILKQGRNVKHLPFAFTEHGAIMAANILNSPQAVQMSVFVVQRVHQDACGAHRYARTRAQAHRTRKGADLAPRLTRVRHRRCAPAHHGIARTRATTTRSARA